MEKLNIKVKYIYNSGFYIETKNNNIIFDYYKGDLNIDNNKDTTFFVSHGHIDHFNPSIFEYKNFANYIISNDITTVDKKENIKFVKPGDNFVFNNLEIKVFSSTDLGCSFYLLVDGINIFHAGDLNWWAWEDSGLEKELEREFNYKKEIDKLANLNIPIDLAFVPVDPRLEHNFYLAGEYFINTIKPKYFFPMHFGDNYNYNNKFINMFKNHKTNIINISNKNQIFFI